MSNGEQSAGRRLSVITIDQAIAGASNVLIAVLAAQLLGVATFGLFGIVFLTYVLAQGVSRALVCDPLLVHPVEAEARTGEVIGTSSVLGLGLAAVVLAGGLAAGIWDSRLGDALVILAACLPLLVFQDLGRYLAFAMRRPARALVLDVTWLVLLFGACIVLGVTGTRTLPWFIAAWAGSGALAGLFLFWQHRHVKVRPGLGWLRHTWGFSWRYLISYSATQGAALTGVSAVGAIAGARALGAVQGAALLVRPFATFQVAAIAATIGEVTRSLDDRAAIRRHVTRASLIVAGIAVANAVVLVVLPDRAGRVVLGDSWHAAKPLLLGAGTQIVGMALVTGVRAGILGMKAIRKAMILDIFGTIALLVGSIGGAIVDGAAGAVWGVAIAQCPLIVAWWLTFLAHMREGAAHEPVGAPDSAELHVVDGQDGGMPERVALATGRPGSESAPG